MVATFIKKIDLYENSFEKWLYTKDILIKLNKCMPVKLINSVYRKDNYYPNLFLEKNYSKLSLEKYKKFWFLGLWKFLLKYKKFSD